MSTPVGFLDLGDLATQHAAQAFLVKQMMARLATADLVQVTAVQPGGVGPTGIVTVQPLVNQIDSDGNATPHGTLPNLPYFRLQGGANAVVIDPAVGDIGVAIFCRRDISTAKSTRKQANPGSRRRYSMSDGLYLGGFLNGIPTQYIQLGSTGILISSPTAIKLATMGPVDINSGGAFTIESSTFTHNGVNIGATHRHSGVATGAGVSGVPQ